jgi:hypothetical protein
MRMARSIFAALLALSVATLPVAGAAALSQKSAEMTTPAFTAPDSGHDCCPDDTKPCDMSMNGCPFMAICAFQGASLSETSLFQFVPPIARQGTAPPSASDVLVPQTLLPALRPPQV